MRRIFFTVITLIFYGCKTPVESKELSAIELEQFAKSEMVGVYHAKNGGVGVVTARKFQCDKLSSIKQHSCELNVGEQMIFLDHHSLLTLTLAKILDEGAHLSYHNRFDARSFGKELITETTGLLVIPWNDELVNE